MDELLELNALKEDCRLRLENLKRQCLILCSIIEKHADLFQNPDIDVLEELSKLQNKVV